MPRLNSFIRTAPLFCFMMLAALMVQGNSGLHGNSEPDNGLDVVFNEELVIGNNENTPREQRLAMPVQIQTNSAGEIMGAGKLSTFTFPSGPSGSGGYALWKDGNARFPKL
jgi:hypothetical protein